VTEGRIAKLPLCHPPPMSVYLAKLRVAPPQLNLLLCIMLLGVVQFVTTASVCENMTVQGLLFPSQASFQVSTAVMLSKVGDP